MRKALVCAVILAFTACGLVCAQSVPPLVNYQGLLTDANGQGLQGTKKLEFNIYDAVMGGSNVWGPQVFSSVPVINGQFNVILGTTDTGGRSIANAFSESQRYLGIKVDDGAEIAPRQQILSTPYTVIQHFFSGQDTKHNPGGNYCCVFWNKCSGWVATL